MSQKPTSLQSLQELILSPKCRNISFLFGAGVSVSAGIPDFRSPGGMYSSLKPELLTATDEQKRLMARDPSMVVNYKIFKENQFPYLEVRRPFILGTAKQQWKATLAHYFTRVCEDKGLLGRVYTQNIDGLDFQTQIPTSKLLGVHGSLGLISCEECKHPVPLSTFETQLRQNIKDIYGIDEEAPKESTPILCENCGKATVKPATVLFGRSLPKDFFDALNFAAKEIDVLFVAGTSLVVYPANEMVTAVGEECVRVIINNEPVGRDLGIVYGEEAERDVFLQGGCDEGFLLLAKKLGWLHDLAKYRDRMCEKSQQLLDQSLQQSSS